MATLRLDELARYDAALDGIGLIIQWEWDHPYRLQAPDLIIERQDVDIELTENKLDTLVWGSNRSWHQGAGQRRLDVPEVSSAFRYFRSEGIDISEPGEAKLLPRTVKFLTLTNLLPDEPLVLVSNDAFVYIAAGNVVKRGTDILAGADFVDVPSGVAGTQKIKDIETDGTKVFIAVEGEGIHSNPGTVIAGGSFQLESFNTTTGWTGNPTFAAITNDKQEGTASLQLLTVATDPPFTGAKTLGGAPHNLSNATQIRFWVETTENERVAGELKMRLITSAGNYFERSLPALDPFTWIQDVTARTNWTSVGTPDWGNINSIELESPAYEIPFRGSTSNAVGDAENGVSQLTLTRPPEAKVGDTMVASVVVSSSSVSLTGPTGWNLLREDLNTNGAIRLVTYWRVVQSGDSSWNWIVDGYVPRLAGMIMAYGVITDLLGSTPSSTGATLHDSNGPIVIPEVNMDQSRGARLVAVAAVNAANERTNGMGFINASLTERENAITSTVLEGASSDTAIVGADEFIDVIGLTGTRSADTVSPTSSNCGGVGFTVPCVDFAGQMFTLRPFATDSRWDDLGYSNPDDAFSSFATHDTRVLGWAKQRIYAAGLKSGSSTQWEFFEVAANGTESVIYIIEDGWQVTDIKELGQMVYFTASRGDRGVIFAYDGENAPFVALRFDPGQIPILIIPFAGSGCLIGVRKVVSSTTAGPGLLYRAFPTASGHLQADIIEEFGEDDGKAYAPRTGFAYADAVYFGLNYGGGTEFAGGGSALGTYLPFRGFGGWAHHIANAQAGVVVGSGIFRGKRLYTIDGQGAYAEHRDGLLVDSGFIISSEIDANLDVNKLWLRQETGFEPLVAGTKVSHEFSTDDGATFTGVVEETVANVTILQTPRNVKSPRIQYKVNLFSDPTTNLLTPILHKSGIGGWPAARPLATHILTIRAFPGKEDRAGARTMSRPQGYELLNDLVTRRDAGDVLDYQPPWYHFSQKVLKVRIAGIETVGPWGVGGKEGQGGFIQLILKEVPGS